MEDLKAFDKIDKSKWLEKVAADLKGRSIDELNWRINDNIIVSPFKDSSDIKESCAPINTKESNQWHSVEPIWVSSDLSKDNAMIIDALTKGASALKFYINKPLDDTELGLLLEGIYFDIVHIEFQLSQQVNFTEFFELFKDLLHRKGFNINEINLSFQLNESQTHPKLISQYPNIKFIGIEGVKYYRGKENIDTELAQILFRTQQVIDHLNISNIEVNSRQFHFSIALDDCYLLNIAAVRALRKLLNLFFRCYGQKEHYDISITGIVAESTMVEDINYNRIKCSSAALSGVIAGLDKLQIYNQKLTSNEEDTFKRKIARNVNHILSLESYLDRVVDPAAGSYYIESLTNTIAQKSWENFQNLWSKENKA